MNYYELFKNKTLWCLRWGGQAIRVSYSAMPKRAVNYNSQGKRRVEISEAR
jgi:hypothetical protein